MTEKLYTVIPIARNRKTGNGDLSPRYDLRPMNHAAACNFMDACRNEFTDYKLHKWPSSVPFPGEPLLSNGYRRDKSKA